MNDNRRLLYLVMSMAASTDRTYTIIGAPIGIFKSRADAEFMARAEIEMQEIIVEGNRFKQRTCIAELPLNDTWPDPSKIQDVWIVWSDLFMQDGSGNAFNRIDGFYQTEVEAETAIKAIEQGPCEHDGKPAKLVSGKRRLALR